MLESDHGPGTFFAVLFMSFEVLVGAVLELFMMVNRDRVDCKKVAQNMSFEVLVGAVLA